jgi:PPOX class probable FMN-dependent enzyme
MSTITTLANLEALYGTPGEASLAKETERIMQAHKTLIDTSPRGDSGSVVHVTDKKTVMMPDRRWNNRVDSLRNIIHDPHVALLFLILDSGNTMRIQGRAKILFKPELLAAYAIEDKEPRCVVVMAVDAIYFQCARAVLRADLWNGGKHVNPRLLPSAGTMLAQTSDGRVGGADYDKTWPARAKTSMW